MGCELFISENKAFKFFLSQNIDRYFLLRLFLVLYYFRNLIIGRRNRIYIKKTPWSESASELYRPSDRRLSAKWLPTFADR
jgi:hypothetical protein